MTRAYREREHLTTSQVSELRAAASFAREMGLPLNTHLTIHWSLSNVGDDPDGRIFAKFRQVFSKALQRRGIPFAAMWVRERGSGGHSEVEHVHMLFHLPAAWRKVRETEIIAIIEKQIELYAGAIYDHTIKMTYPDNGDIRYLLKGARPQIQKDLRLKREWQKSQGVIRGKRAGFTQNLGPTARRRYRSTKGSTINIVICDQS